MIHRPLRHTHLPLPALSTGMPDEPVPHQANALFWLDLAQALGIAVLLVSALFLIMGFLIMPGLPSA